MTGISPRAVPNFFPMSKGPSFFVPYITSVTLDSRCHVSEAPARNVRSGGTRCLYNEYAEEYTAGNESER